MQRTIKAIIAIISFISTILYVICLQSCNQPLYDATFNINTGEILMKDTTLKITFIRLEYRDVMSVLIEKKRASQGFYMVNYQLMDTSMYSFSKYKWDKNDQLEYIDLEIVARNQENKKIFFDRHILNDEFRNKIELQSIKPYK